MNKNTINILKQLCEENIGISKPDLITALIGYASQLCTVPGSRIATINKHVQLISMIEHLINNIDIVIEADKKNARIINDAEKEVIEKSIG